MDESQYTDHAPRGEGLCECGCGQLAPIAKRTVRSRGRIKGQPMRFIRGHNAYGVDRSGPRQQHYMPEDRGYVTPCWIWQLRKMDTGYGKMRANGREQLAHRYYFEQANGPIPEGLQLDHKCQVPECVNPDHLEPVTPLENTRRSGATKLTLKRAREVEQLARAGVSGYTIAGWYGVSRQTVDLIRRNGATAPRRAGRSDG